MRVDQEEIESHWYRPLLSALREPLRQCTAKGLRRKGFLSVQGILTVISWIVKRKLYGNSAEYRITISLKTEIDSKMSRVLICSPI